MTCGYDMVTSFLRPLGALVASVMNVRSPLRPLAGPLVPQSRDLQREPCMPLRAAASTTRASMNDVPGPHDTMGA